LSEKNSEVLELVKFYFETDFSVNSLVIDKAIEIIYHSSSNALNNDESLLKTTSTKSTTYGVWTEYNRTKNYAKQWVSDKLRNVDKIYEKRTNTVFSDWQYDGVTTCKTFKPGDTDYTKYVKKENCGFLGIGNIYRIYKRTSYTNTEYRQTYELKAGVFDPTVDKMPKIDVEGREEFYIGKTIFYDYVMIPYHGDHKYFEVDMYFNNHYYNNEKDNFISSKSSGANSGSAEQNSKV
jgi:hypothetical protein